MNTLKITVAAFGLVALSAGTAAAQQSDFFNPETPEYVTTPIGAGVSIGGGVMGFTDDDARDFTDPGGAWEARLVVGTRLPIALEAAYIGSAQDIDALGLDDDAVLVGNGVEGVLRVNLLTDDIQPYILAGVGYKRYTIANEDFNNSNLEDGDDIGEVPLGAGISYRFPDMGLMVDLRGTFRAAFSDNLMDAAVVGDPRLDTWGVDAKVGWEF